MIKVGKVIAVIIAVGMIVLIGIGAAIFHRGSQIQGEMALVGAAANGNTTQVETLLARGVNVNATAFDGTSGLWTAAFNRRLSTVILLLRHGANPNTPSQFGQTPLEAAVENLSHDTGTASAAVDVSIIKLLLSKGTSVVKVKQDAPSVALLNSYSIKI